MPHFSTLLLLLAAIAATAHAAATVQHITARVQANGTAQFAIDPVLQVVYGASATNRNYKVIAVSDATAAAAYIDAPQETYGAAHIDTRATALPLHGVFFAMQKTISFMDLSAPDHNMSTVSHNFDQGQMLQNIAVSGTSLFLTTFADNCIFRGDIVWDASAPVSTMALDVTVVAGNCNTSGHVDGNALTVARFNRPGAVAVTGSGQTMFTGSVSGGVRKVFSMLPSAKLTRMVSSLPVAFPTPDAYTLAMHPTVNHDDDFIIYTTGSTFAAPKNTAVWSLQLRAGNYTAAPLAVLTNGVSMTAWPTHGIAVLNDGRLLVAALSPNRADTALFTVTDPQRIPPYKAVPPTPAPVTPSPSDAKIQMMTCNTKRPCASEVSMGCTWTFLPGGCDVYGATARYRFCTKMTNGTAVLNTRYYKTASCDSAVTSSASFMVGKCFVQSDGSSYSITQCKP